jgi:hypothetical protein
MLSLIRIHRIKIYYLIAILVFFVKECIYIYNYYINIKINFKLISKKVDAICLYLREKYFYCVWCASTYENDDNLTKYCPGLSQIDHEYDE